MTTAPQDLHHFTLKDGNFRGRRITSVPLSHLKWMVSNGHEHAEHALAEMQRRGTPTPELDVTGHAIDRVSLQCLKIWRQDRQKDEGLHTWLARVATEALQLKAPAAAPERRKHKGLKFIFKFEGGWPVLLTVAKLTKPSKAPPGRAP